jgi:hypothetical protein
MLPSPNMVFMTRMRAKIHALGIAAFAVTLAGCVTAPPPVQLLDRAQSEIRAARASGAATTAPMDLAEAERRLAAAQQFAANKDFGKATASAEEAEAAAATARARARLAQLNQQINEKTTLNQQLQADLERRQAAAAAAQQAALAPLPAPASSTALPAAGSSAALPAAGSSAGANAPVMLPSIQLGQPTVPPPASAGEPASAGSAGGQP